MRSGSTHGGAIRGLPELFQLPDWVPSPGSPRHVPAPRSKGLEVVSGVEGEGAAGQAKPGARPKICPRGSLQRPLPSLGWPQFTRLPAHPCRPPGTGCLSPILRAAQCTELGSGQTQEGGFRVSAKLYRPCTAGLKGGWAKEVGGGGGALGDTEPHTRKTASRVKTQLHSRPMSPARSFGACKTCTLSPGSKRDMEAHGRPPGERPLPSLQESGACLVVSVLPTEVGLKVHGPEEETGNQRTELGFEPTWERSQVVRAQRLGNPDRRRTASVPGLLGRSSRARPPRSEPAMAPPAVRAAKEVACAGQGRGCRAGAQLAGSPPQPDGWQQRGTSLRQGELAAEALLLGGSLQGCVW
ncbi:uncharacterized protein LOC116566852 isoform X1 [Mustela erminea]|uniref:uncharacterized protein LOC116566852 isoform X1 n=1 Tax=Mustela erminea TaxID=36723 RepID=UPI00138679A6|nr:uncharacterized protein LOC116566852 isoform X1 [Mustela erminea]